MEACEPCTREPSWCARSCGQAIESRAGVRVRSRFAYACKASSRWCAHCFLAPSRTWCWQRRTIRRLRHECEHRRASAQARLRALCLDDREPVPRKPRRGVARGGCDSFAGFIVHEAARIFHNWERATIGVPSTRKKEWLPDIEYRKRETFAYSCEAYSRVFQRGKSRGERRAPAEDLRPRSAHLRGTCGCRSRRRRPGGSGGSERLEGHPRPARADMPRCG